MKFETVKERIKWLRDLRPHDEVAVMRGDYVDRVAKVEKVDTDCIYVCLGPEEMTIAYHRQSGDAVLSGRWYNSVLMPVSPETRERLHRKKLEKKIAEVPLDSLSTAMLEALLVLLKSAQANPAPVVANEARDCVSPPPKLTETQQLLRSIADSDFFLIPGYDYLLDDGRTVRFIEYLCNAQHIGYTCWVHGTLRQSKVFVTDRLKFVKMVG